MKLLFWLVALLVCIVALPATLLAVAPGSEEEILERIKPFGKLCRVGDSCVTAGMVARASDVPRSGMEVYNSYCFACHTTGASQAPILGDRSVWRARIGKGADALYESTLNGLNLMPARGTCINCSDDELQATVDYMLEQSR